MDISYLELINEIKKAERENEKADIWRSIFWNMPIEQEKERGCKYESKEK